MNLGEHLPCLDLCILIYQIRGLKLCFSWQSYVYNLTNKTSLMRNCTSWSPNCHLKMFLKVLKFCSYFMSFPSFFPYLVPSLYLSLFFPSFLNIRFDKSQEKSPRREQLLGWLIQPLNDDTIGNLNSCQGITLHSSTC